MDEYWESFGSKYDSMYREIDVSVGLDSTALLVVDVQRKSCDPTVEHGVGTRLRQKYPELAERYFERIRTTTLPNIEQLVAAFRAHGMPVLFFTVGPVLPDGSDMPGPFRQQYSDLHAGDGSVGVLGSSPEYALMPSLKPEPSELVINKVARSAFCGTVTELSLRSMGISSVVVVGGATHACVASTARHASDLGFGTVLVEDACHSVFSELHGATMTVFRMGLGRVMATQQVVDAFARHAQ